MSLRSGARPRAQYAQPSAHCAQQRRPRATPATRLAQRPTPGASAPRVRGSRENPRTLPRHASPPAEPTGCNAPLALRRPCRPALPRAPHHLLFPMQAAATGPRGGASLPVQRMAPLVPPPCHRATPTAMRRRCAGYRPTRCELPRIALRCSRHNGSPRARIVHRSHGEHSAAAPLPKQRSPERSCGIPPARHLNLSGQRAAYAWHLRRARAGRRCQRPTAGGPWSKLRCLPRRPAATAALAASPRPCTRAQLCEPPPPPSKVSVAPFAHHRLQAAARSAPFGSHRLFRGNPPRCIAACQWRSTARCAARAHAPATCPRRVPWPSVRLQFAAASSESAVPGS
mmetsp:Transcript_100885/g.284615  ORF Transcript_100885/g.284615 Transcript_100885/m.284615 type:complete len:342 (-) Transcript_100885:491-1516(-)